MPHPIRRATALVLGLALVAVDAAAATSLEEAARLQEADRHRDAVALLRRLERQGPPQGEVARRLGRSLLALGEAAAAAEWLERAVEREPRSADAHYWLGQAQGRLAMEAGVVRQALLAGRTRAAFERAVELDPRHLGARQALVEYYLLAPALLGGGVDKAEGQAAAIGRFDAAAGHRASGRIALHREDLPRALAAWRAAVASEPGHRGARFQLATLLQRMERWDEAVEQLSALLARDPDDFDALYQIGRTAAATGRHLSAGEAALRRYLGSTPGAGQAPLAWAHLRLGQVLAHRGDRAAARQHYRQALRLDPALEEAQRALDG